ncbi:MAG: DUF4215 domain-containing protein [Candidatus Peregrinibacteria bacterium]|nr:DUF4215 domain-containing protein [Candidatus Peregrinibacteria bacterium]MDZ4245224.1 DUF4215 domain-containing protein [Candidatus Gracilibacteria bacterium]
MIQEFLFNKYRVLSLTLFLVGMFFLSSLVYAINVEETFVFESVVEPSAVQFTGMMTGQPRYNSGVNYFHSFLGNSDFVDPAYQLRVVASSALPAETPFQLEGFAWNNPWGWISFKCAGGLNRAQPCGDDTYQTQIDLSSYTPANTYGLLTGQAWNPNIGEINFSWTCPGFTCFPPSRPRINFTTGLLTGYGWNDRVGWMYFQGSIEPPPTLGGFVCGDGIPDTGEECDDGVNNGDPSSSTCNADCTTNICGDGSVNQTVGEQCDDNNVFSGDGCSSTCQNEVPAVCGNGVPQVGEECDDGNSVNDDACTNACILSVCGDGIASAVIGEECDDGNNIDTDACKNNCTLSPPTQICGDGSVTGTETCDLGSDAYGNSLNKPNTVCPLCQNYACGDHYLYPAYEQCDDGNLDSGDGCDALCNDEVPGAICGNNIQEIGEACDDGNLDSGDGCDALCNDEVPWAVCGNSVIEPNSRSGGDEECDDGNKISGDGCNSKCKIEAAWCGDGIANGTEQCDDGNIIDNDVCKNNCTFGAYSICGDGDSTFGEECDDGNTLSGDGCSSVCTLDSDEPKEPFVSINDCEDVVSYMAQMFNIQLDSNSICNEFCGDGYLEDPEECEDGNIVGGDGCSSTCIDESAGAVCGNYIQEIGEGCDDGNNNSGDGCSASCTDEDQIIYLDDPTCEEVFEIFEDILNIDIYAAGFCNTNPAYCGNGTWDIGQEECDPTDTSDVPYYLYCTNFCEFEPVGWCGDGIHDPGEECDDGNFQDGDGCNEWCEYEFEPGTCGDGLWSLGEECDPGVAASIPLTPPGLTCGAAISTTPCELLTAGFCGDGETQHGEECDSSDPLHSPPAGSVCTSSCELEFIPEQLTCFPYTDIAKTWNDTKGDVYEVSVQLNCLEEPSSVNEWNVSVTGFHSINTVDCDQINGNTPGCVQEDPMLPITLNAPETGMTKVAEVYSYAPTGYTSMFDDDNSYTLSLVEVEVTNANGSIYKEWVPTDNYSMDFTPLISSQTLDASYGDNVQVPYLNLGYEQLVDLRSVLKNNLNDYVDDVSADYTLSVSNPSYVFQFDNFNNNAWDSAVGLSTLHRNGGTMSNPTWYGLNPNPGLYYHSAGVTGSSQAEEPEGESLSMVINYTRDGHDISYPADSIPKAADFLLDGYGVQITGPVNTDKILGASSFTQVGNVGEAVKRKNITGNVSRIVKSSDIAASSPTSFSFITNLILSGGDYLTYVVSTGGPVETDQHIFYFKDDVILSTGLDNRQNRAIITEGGDVYINDDIFNLPLDPNDLESEDARLEIIALKDKYGRGGNVFIGPNVVYLSANIVADGSLFPYDGNSRNGSVPDFEVLESTGLLDNQLTFEGSLTSNNTIGGSESGPLYKKGDGSVTLIENEARIYDLNFFRRHGLIPGSTDSAGNPQDCNGVSGLQIEDSYLTANTCDPGDSTSSDLNPAGDRWVGRAANENYGMYFNYRPPAKNSVIFGGVGRVTSGN